MNAVGKDAAFETPPFAVTVTVVAKTATTVTVGWHAPPWQAGYVTTLDGSETMKDGKRHASVSRTAKTAKIGRLPGSHSYGVKLLAAVGEGSVRL